MIIRPSRARRGISSDTDDCAGKRLCSCSDSPSPPTPDPAIGQAAAANAEIGKEALAFSKQVYEEGKPRQAKYAELVDKVVNQQLTQSDTNAALAQDYTDYMKGTFRPIEKALADEAATAGGTADQERLAGQAGTDVAKAFEAGRGAQVRDLQRVGVNPNSGAYLSADTSSRVMEAATRAGAMNNAREQAKNLGWAKKMDVVNVGRNLPSNQATSSSLALNSGNSAVSNAAAPNTMANLNAAQLNSGFGTSMNANTAAGGLYTNQFGAQMSGYNAQQQADAAKWAGLGQLATTGAMLYLSGGTAAAATPAVASSKKFKHNKEKISGEIVLKGLKKLPIEKWDYKKGVADEGRHIGAYAEDFKKEFGVGDGKTISVVDAVGVSMAAIKGLSKQVDRIERQVKINTAEVCRHGI